MTLLQIRQANANLGHHFFEPSTMHFFQSRISNRTYLCPEGTLFVTSEKGPSGVRKYSVRLAKKSGEVCRAEGETFQEHKTAKDAHRRARFIASGK